MALEDYFRFEHWEKLSPVTLSAVPAKTEGKFYLAGKGTDNINHIDEGREFDIKGVKTAAASLAKLLEKERKYKIINNV